MIREAMQSADLSLYPKFGLIFFLVVFLGVCIYAMWGMSPEDRDRVSREPLDDGQPLGGQL